MRRVAAHRALTGKRHPEEKECSIIAKRTRAALARKKAAGAILGNRTNLGLAQTMGQATNRARADAFAANVLPILRQIQAAGAKTPRAIAAALNDRGIRTARGGNWYHSTVRNILRRASVDQEVALSRTAAPSDGKSGNLPVSNPDLFGSSPMSLASIFAPSFKDPIPFSKEEFRRRLRQELSFATLILGEKEGRLLWKEVAMKRRGKSRGWSAQPARDQELLWLYDSLVDQARIDSVSIKSLPRRIGQHIYAHATHKFGNSAIAISKKLRRLLKARDEATLRRSQSSGSLINMPTAMQKEDK